MTDANHRPSEMDRLAALRETGLLESGPNPAFAAICAEVRERFGVSTAFVTLVDRSRLVIAAPERGEVPREHGFCDHTIRGDSVLVVPDLAADPRFAENPLVVDGPRFRFYAGAPLIFLDGVRLGALCALDQAPRDFSLGDRAELALLADRVVGLIAASAFPPPAELAIR